MYQKIEQKDAQLAGISSAAAGWGINEEQCAKQGDWGWSVPYQDVLDLRRAFENLRRDNMALWATNTILQFAYEIKPDPAPEPTPPRVIHRHIVE